MIAAFDHPFLSGLLGDAELAKRFGVEAEIAAMVRFEVGLAHAEAEAGMIAAAAAATISADLKAFVPDMAALKAGVEIDGVLVPALVEQLRRAVGKEAAGSLHLGATSQDVTDTALTMRLRSCLALLEARLRSIVDALSDIEARFGTRALIGRTRMQAAIPITVSDRVSNWRAPLVRHRERLEAVRRDVLVIQFGGAAGTLDKLGSKGPAVRSALARLLGLVDVPQWHSQRDRIVELGKWLSQVTGSLGKIGQDVALLAQAGDEIELAGGGKSSAMAHKQNPVDAEVLVALARFNAVQIGGLHQALVHEQERSGAAWTLEWMILPQMLMATGAATLRATSLLGHIRSLGT